MKEGVKEKIKVYENKYFITYKYILENGNSYKESEPKWVQKDFGNSVTITPEEHMERQLDKLIYRR